MRKHGQRPKLRQLAPAMVAPALLMSALTPLTPWAALPGLAWLTASLGYGALLGMRAGSSCAFGSGLAAALMHVGWSAGFWRQTFSPTPKPAEGSLAAE
jgi:succinoglycan biosynthesis protein ExoA